jgi:hypothetical protein
MITIITSHAVTISGIPEIYVAVAVLLILFALYLLCRVKRKYSRYVMKKSSYMRLFIACLVVIFFYNLYNSYNSLWLVNPFSIIILALLVSFVESFIPFLILVLLIHTIKCYSKSKEADSS